MTGDPSPTTGIAISLALGEEAHDTGFKTIRKHRIESQSFIATA